MNDLESKFKDTENLNETYAEILELTAARLRSLNYKISIGTIENIEKISKNIIDQGKDEIEYEQLKREGKTITSKNKLAYRMSLEKNIDSFKIQSGDKTEEDIDKEIDALVEFIKDENDSECHTIDE